MTGNIAWLASYPKSGNTWIRSLLTAYRGQGEFSINQLETDGIASSRALIDQQLGLKSADLNGDEIESLRPLAYKHLSKTKGSLQLIKVHDAFTVDAGGLQLFPNQATHATVYILRNPFDVAVSYRYHNQLTLDQAVEALNNQHEIADQAKGINQQVSQRMLDWSGHVTSWLNAPGMNVLTIRYEDLKHDTASSFGAVVRHLGLPYDEVKIDQAIQATRFEKLQQQEQQGGFAEKPPAASAFFRQGKVGAWRQEFTQELWRKINDQHQAVMQQVGYNLDDYRWES